MSIAGTRHPVALTLAQWVAVIPRFEAFTYNVSWLTTVLSRSSWGLNSKERLLRHRFLHRVRFGHLEIRFMFHYHCSRMMMVFPSSQSRYLVFAYFAGRHLKMVRIRSFSSKASSSSSKSLFQHPYTVYIYLLPTHGSAWKPGGSPFAIHQ